MKETFSESLKTILSKMCEMVGTNYDKINFDKNGWYREFEWTEEDEDVFKKWLIDYLYTNTKARNEIMAFPNKTKRYAKKVANEFCFMYGWKYKNKAPIAQ